MKIRVVWLGQIFFLLFFAGIMGWISYILVTKSNLDVIQGIIIIILSIIIGVLFLVKGLSLLMYREIMIISFVKGKMKEKVSRAEVRI